MAQGSFYDHAVWKLNEKLCNVADKAIHMFLLMALKHINKVTLCSYDKSHSKVLKRLAKITGYFYLSSFKIFLHSVCYRIGIENFEARKNVFFSYRLYFKIISLVIISMHNYFISIAYSL